ncbi:MAG: LysM peptidoglycan-binding domain-containing protein [Nitrosomonadales bacterium]
MLANLMDWMQNLSCRLSIVRRLLLLCWSFHAQVYYIADCCLLPTFALADPADVRDNAPDRHVVVKGDTLWGISATFSKDPWKWPQIWGVNKDTIKDPHWIYPGDVILLDRATGTLRVGGSDATGSPSTDSAIVKLYPKIQSTDSEHGVIPSIPVADITPFLSQPLVVEKDGLAGAPSIISTYEQHVIVGNDDIAYVKGLTAGEGTHWQIYRPEKPLKDPDNGQILGYEIAYLGDADVEKFGEISTIRISKAIQEIKPGDNLIQTPETLTSNYVPHAPDHPVDAQIISIYGGVMQGGQNSVVALNRGQRDGLEDGHVLALFRKGEKLNKNFTLPDVRYGLLFVFRTFEKVSYALVMQTSLPVELLDRAHTP